MDFSKILSHPDKDEVIAKLVNGIKPKDISDWLKLKYPDKSQAHLKISAKMLKDFLDKNIDLYSKLEQDIKDTKEGKKQDKKIFESLQNNKSYKERLNELADDEIDLKRTLAEVGHLAKIRIEQYFDRMQENPGNLKPDYGLIKWLEMFTNWAEKYNSIVNNSPDQIIQHNVTMQVLDNRTAIFQDAIREVLNEMDPDAAMLFMDKLNSKIQVMQEPQEPPKMKFDDKMNQAKLLKQNVEDLEINE